MLQALLPASATRIIVYLKPINIRSGPAKLRELCATTIGIEPNAFTAFLFTNKSRDTLLMYFEDSTGDQTVMKKLERGAFLLPAPEQEGAAYVIMRPKVLGRLFR